MGWCASQNRPGSVFVPEYSAPIEPLPAIEKPKKPFNPDVSYKVNSRFPKETIKYKPITPEISERKVYRYNCPLCFQYYDHMLQCSKCFNYSCRFCGDDIGDRSLEQLIIAHCPFCDATPFILEDVNENDPIKKYTDTPYSSAVSGFKFTGGRTIFKAKLQANHDNDSKENQEDLQKNNSSKFYLTFPNSQVFINEDEPQDFAKSANTFGCERIKND